MKRDWRIINKRIRECMASEDPLKCLLRLFGSTNDGWVAFKIGEYYESNNNLREALEYYKKARNLLPLAKYKMLAESRIDKIQDNLGRSYDELYVVSCTKQKIWDTDTNAPKYVAAKDAYRGDHFIKWLSCDKSKKVFWIIFSSKYGFIAPDQPIENYDIHITDEGAITEEMMLKQIKYHSFYDRKISDFKRIYFIGSDLYFDKVKKIFEMAGLELRKYEFEELDELDRIDKNKRVDARIETYKRYLREFLNQELVSVRDLNRNSVPEGNGIYGFYDPEGKLIYIGTSENLRRRIFTNHLRGNANASTLRRKLKKKLGDEKSVTSFLEGCMIKFLPLLDIKPRMLKLLEHFFIAILLPELND